MTGFDVDIQVLFSPKQNLTWMMKTLIDQHTYENQITLLEPSSSTLSYKRQEFNDIVILWKGGVKQRELELGERMPDEALDIIGEQYKKVTDWSFTVHCMAISYFT